MDRLVEVDVHLHDCVRGIKKPEIMSEQFRVTISQKSAGLEWIKKTTQSSSIKTTNQYIIH